MGEKEYKFLDEIDVWILDMDGTIFLDDALIEGAKEFIESLRQKGKRFLFLTNNSSNSCLAYVRKLQSLGLKTITEKDIYTSGQAAIQYIKKHHPNKTAFLLGTPELEEEFIRSGIQLSDESNIVVIGFDTSITYQKLWKVCDLVRKGLPYIATHPDLNCPTKTGFKPDIGAIIAFIKASTGREPDAVIGKPNRYILQMISEKWDTPFSKMVMIGDRLYTDIAMGKEGIKTVLVLSGESKEEDLKNSSFHPDLVVSSVKKIAEYLQSDIHYNQSK